MKLAIVGSRSFTDYKLLSDTLRPFLIEHDDLIIVSGGARGADSLAARWANANHLPLVEFIPDWGRNGRRAGYLRNREICDYADAGIAFWDGDSRGTTHAISIMTMQDKPIIVVNYKEMTIVEYNIEKWTI